MSWFVKSIKSSYIDTYNNIYKQVDTLDPDDKFHIGHYTATINDKGMYELTFAYGGNSLNMLNYYQVDNRKFLLGFANIFNAIVQLNNNDIYHADIKTPNIVMSADYVFKLIDFGISFSNYNDLKPIFLKYYSYWPPESIMLAQHKKCTDEQITCRINNWVNDEYLRDLSPHTADFKYLEQLTMQHRHLICKNLDVYALGLTLYDLINRLIDLSNTFRFELNSLAYEMTHLNIHNRIDITTA
jgi:serine/threonine protein kinase